MSSILRTNNKDSKKLLHQDLRVNETSRKCAWAVSCAAKALSPLSSLNSDTVDLVASGSAEPGFFRRCLDRMCCVKPVELPKASKASKASSTQDLIRNGRGNSGSAQKSQSSMSEDETVAAPEPPKNQTNNQTKKPTKTPRQQKPLTHQAPSTDETVAAGTTNTSGQNAGPNESEGSKIFLTDEITAMGLTDVCDVALKKANQKSNAQKLTVHDTGLPNGVEEVYARAGLLDSGIVIIVKEGKMITHLKVSTNHAKKDDCENNIVAAARNALIALNIYNVQKNQPIVDENGVVLGTSPAACGAVLLVPPFYADGTRHADVDDETEVNAVLRGFNSALTEPSFDPRYFPVVQFVPKDDKGSDAAVFASLGFNLERADVVKARKANKK